MSDSLYVDLFSNASLDLYPRNKVSQFTVSLAQPIQLEGEYECGLSQLICPPTTQFQYAGESEPLEIFISCRPETDEHRTIGKRSDRAFPFGEKYSDVQRKALRRFPSKNFVSYNYSPSSGEFASDIPHTFRYTLRMSDFDSAEKLLHYVQDIFTGETPDSLLEGGLTEGQKSENLVIRDLLQKRVQRNVGHPYAFTLSKGKNNRLIFMIRDADMNVALPSNFALLFGLTVADGQMVFYENTGEYELSSEHGIDFKATRPSVLAVYTNLVGSHHVGDTKAPLLRVITLPKEDRKAGDFHSISFQDVHYLPVSIKFIQEAQIELRGNDGSLIPFEGGISYCRLHFRKRRQ